MFPIENFFKVFLILLLAMSVAFGVVPAIAADGTVAVQRDTISKKADGLETNRRLGARGEQLVIPIGIREHGLADEGSYFVNINPTIGTGVKLQGDTTTAWVATTPSILIVNNDVAGQPGSRNIYLDYVKLIDTGAGAGLAQLQAAVLIDNSNRYASGGTNVTANTVNVNMLSPNKSIALVYYGATASSATSQVRQIGRAVLRGAIPVVNDQYILSFGGGESGLAAGGIGGTNIIAQMYPFAPVVIGPQQSVLVYLYAGSMSTSPSTEYEIAWHER